MRLSLAALLIFVSSCSTDSERWDPLVTHRPDFSAVILEVAGSGDAVITWSVGHASNQVDTSETGLPWRQKIQLVAGETIALRARSATAGDPADLTCRIRVDGEEVEADHVVDPGGECTVTTVIGGPVRGGEGIGL